ncbi:MAG: crossover junction endodeoxyribonuclease RuvC [Bacteroidetes bacterium]|nr:crossover junction endodeoxyribonuclease RuvC [Bacteroidota bacterium]
MQQPNRIILGIDPGTVIMGYGVLECAEKSLKTIAIGVVKLDKYEDQADRLKKIFEQTTAIINQYKPTEMAIEAPFYGKNVQSMLKLGRAQGIAIAAALNKNLPITEYSPKKVKVSITGNGNAGKEQVAEMIKTLLKIEVDSKFFDSTDAMAVALCHYNQGSVFKKSNKNSSNSWKAFVNANTNRIVK